MSQSSPEVQHVLVPDLPEFRQHRWEGINPIFYADDTLPAGLPPVQGLIAWNASAAMRRQLLHLPGLRWTLVLLAGVDQWLAEVPESVDFYNAKTLHHEAVAQHAAALMLAVARGLYQLASARQWTAKHALPPLYNLKGREVVLWGYGHIGTQLEKLLTPFGAHFTRLNSSTTQADIDAALHNADDLVLLLPLTDETRHIVDASVLGKLKAGAWLYNLGRGELVDTDALLTALQENGNLGGAALDVTDPEPLPAQHPLWQQPNVLITPHIASTTDDQGWRAAQYAADFVAKMLRGEPLDKVKVQRDKGY